jgi:hypothetical protein
MSKFSAAAQSANSLSTEKLIDYLASNCDTYNKDWHGSRIKLREKLGHKDSYNALEILSAGLYMLDVIEVLADTGVIPEAQMHELGCRFAEYAMAQVGVADPEYVELLRLKRRWINGEVSTEELAAYKERAMESYVNTETRVYDGAENVRWAVGMAALPYALEAMSLPFFAGATDVMRKRCDIIPDESNRKAEKARVYDEYTQIIVDLLAK